MKDREHVREKWGSKGDKRIALAVAFVRIAGIQLWGFSKHASRDVQEAGTPACIYVAKMQVARQHAGRLCGWHASVQEGC